jgi:hypothetical protein
MPTYEAIAHVLWELPFPLRLPPEMFAIWEPAEGVAFFDPRPGIGEVTWRRSSSLITPAAAGVDAGPPNSCFPEYDYRLTSVLKSGEEVTTAVLTRGPDGGFTEPRQYALANIFLCLRRREDYAAPETVTRASEALNNLLEIYRFVSMDPSVRAVRAEHDAYYNVVSVGLLPSDLGDVDVIAALRKIGQVRFGREIGVTRSHHIGLNSFDDLFARDQLPTDNFRIFERLVRFPHELELFHQLILSAVRRLKRTEHALAVLDAQSAFETLVAALVAEHLRRVGTANDDLERLMAPGGRVHALQQRLVELDRIAASPSAPPRAFLGSTEEREWRTKTYKLRNRVVHEGLRAVTFDEAKEAITAALRAISAVQNLTVEFNRSMMWSEPLDLAHVQETGGRLTRLFEV